MSSLQPAGCRRYIAMRLRNSSAESLATRMTLFLLLWPEAMVTEDRGTFKSLAKNSMHASFARPSMGGVVKETLRASPISPVMAFFFARGRTFTAKLTPSSNSWIASMKTLLSS
jgi:hypothetical protein